MHPYFCFGVSSGLELQTQTDEFFPILFYSMRIPFQRLIFWCPRRRGTTPIHLELGGETLLR